MHEWCVCLSIQLIEGLCLGVLIHLSSSAIDQSHPPSYPWSSLAVDHAHWSLTNTTCPQAKKDHVTNWTSHVNSTEVTCTTNLIGIACSVSPSSFWLSSLRYPAEW